MWSEVNQKRGFCILGHEIFFLFLVKESGGADFRCLEDDQDERRGFSIVLGCCINNMAYFQEGITIVLMMGLLY